MQFRNMTDEELIRHTETEFPIGTLERELAKRLAAVNDELDGYVANTRAVDFNKMDTEELHRV